MFLMSSCLNFLHFQFAHCSQRFCAFSERIWLEVVWTCLILYLRRVKAGKEHSPQTSVKLIETDAPSSWLLWAPAAAPEILVTPQTRHLLELIKLWLCGFGCLIKRTWMQGVCRQYPETHNVWFQPLSGLQQQMTQSLSTYFIVCSWNCFVIMPWQC